MLQDPSPRFPQNLGGNKNHIKSIFLSHRTQRVYTKKQAWHFRRKSKVQTSSNRAILLVHASVVGNKFYVFPHVFFK
jgi:hypothetical protein